MKPKKQTKFKKICEGTLIVAAMLIVGFATIFIISSNYSAIYNGISTLTKTAIHKDLNQTIDFLRGIK